MECCSIRTIDGSRFYGNATDSNGAVNDISVASNSIKLTDTNPKTFRIKSNAIWKTTISGTNIMTHNILASGGVDNIATTAPGENNYTITS